MGAGWQRRFRGIELHLPEYSRLHFGLGDRTDMTASKCAGPAAGGNDSAEGRQTRSECKEGAGEPGQTPR